MCIQKFQAWLFAQLILFAACLTGVVSIQAAQMPAYPGNLSGVPSKNSKPMNRTQPKDGKSKAADARRKQSTPETRAETRARAETAMEIAQLKQQLAVQQKQIDQLLHAVSRLQAEVETQPMPAAVPDLEPASEVAVASLAPILPPATSARPADANRVMAIETPMALPRTKKSKQPDAAGLRSTMPVRSAVTSSESVPVGQERKPGLLTFDHGKIKVGTMFFGLYRYYPKTGFGPQTLPISTIQARATAGLSLLK